MSTLRWLSSNDEGTLVLTPSTATVTGLQPPQIAMAELPGGLLLWPIDAPADAAPTMRLYDLEDADWVWQLCGECAHLALLAGAQQIDGDLDGALTLLVRRLATVNWAQAWWPASRLEALPTLSDAALRREAAQIIAALDEHYGIAVESELVGEPVDELAGLDGLDGLAEQDEHPADAEDADAPPAPVPLRQRYALAAGGERESIHSTFGLICGFEELAWQAVPAGVFDAAECPVAWKLIAGERIQELQVHTALLPSEERRGSAAGVAVRVAAPGADAAGVLDADGAATLPLLLNAAETWSLTEADVTVQVGAAQAPAESAEMRAAVREVARMRLHAENELTLEAERQAAEADY